MYFDGTTLTALLADAETAAANAPGIAADVRAQTSPLAVIEAAIELPELGEAGVTAFLDEHRIELRDMPPRHRLIEDALASDGKLKDRVHAACAAYYETDLAVLPLPVPEAPQAHTHEGHTHEGHTHEAHTPEAHTPEAHTPHAE